MTGEYIRQYTGLLSDWGISAFTGATLDWLFSFHNTDSHLLNVLSAMFQFTLATFMIHEVTYAVGLRRPTNTIQNTWITYFALWNMSPNAVSKLENSYYAFHRLLYGSSTKKEENKSTV